MEIAKKPGGPFGLEAMKSLGAGQTKSFQLKVINPDLSPVELRIYENSASPNYKSRYFRKGDNITQDVKNGEGEFTVGGSQAKRFVLKITRKQAAGPTGCVIASLEFGAGSDIGDVYALLNSDSACGS